MKKIILLTLHYIFFITALIYLPNEVSIYIAILLISVLALDKIYYTILPLALCFYYPIELGFILIGVFICHLSLYTFIKKNRFYALTVNVLSQLSVLLILFFQDKATIISVEMILTLLIIYAIVNILYTYQVADNKTYVFPYKQRLIYLTLILTYFVFIFKYGQTYLLMPFLFMQLFLIKDYRYKIIFTSIYALVLIFFIPSQILEAPKVLAISFFPPITLLLFSYDTFLWIPLAIYTLLVTIFNWPEKKISFENDYINSLFADFTKYINQLSLEYNKNNTIKALKTEKIEEISQHYCSHCHKNTLCRNKLDRRYSFLAGAIQGIMQNVYDCPNYSKFYVDTNIEMKPKNYEYSGMRALADELSFLYNQSLALKDDYEFFLGYLQSYGYQILNIDIHLSSPTLYFSIEFSKNKIIIEDLFLKLAYKAFGERLEIKTIINENKYVVHFYKAPEIKISYAHTILAKNDNLMSGDNYYIKKDYNCSYIFALSDGMGSGYNAYLESVDALNTISLLSSYHFSIKTILRLLEDVYDLKNNYDRYATLDLLHINTANRKMNLYKMGSTTTYILHNNQLFAYENNALPYQLDAVNSAYEIDIYSGDYIFLLSDGISDFISKEEFYSIVSNGFGSAEKMCDDIVGYIKRKEQNQLKDDLSLIAIKAI